MLKVDVHVCKKNKQVHKFSKYIKTARIRYLGISMKEEDISEILYLVKHPILIKLSIACTITVMPF